MVSVREGEDGECVREGEDGEFVRKRMVSM